MAFLLINPADTARKLFVLGDPLRVNGGSAGGGVAAVDADLALDFDGVADATLMSTAILGTAKVGGAGWTAAFQAGGSHPTGTPSNVHVVDDATSPSYAAPFNIGGSSYDASEDKVVRVGFVGRTGSDARWEKFGLTAPGSLGATGTVQFFFKPGRFGDTGADSAVDIGGIENASAGFAIADQGIAAAVALTSVGEIHAHSNTGHNSAGPQLVADTWYLVTVRLNASATRAEILVRVAATGAIHYAGTRTANVATDIASMLGPGNYLVAYANGEYQYLKGWVMAWGANATMPLGAITIPAPDSVTAEQTDVDEVTATASGTKGFEWKVERNKNSAGWTTVAAANATAVYVDTDVADGDSLLYRFSAIIGETTGSATTSGAATVDNGAFPWAFDEFAGGADLSDLNDRASWNGGALDFYVRNTGVIQGAASRGRVFYEGTVSANHRSEVDLVIGANQGYALSIGAACRISADRTNNYEAVVVYVSGATKVQLRKRNAGTNAQIGTDYAVAVTTGSELSIEATGTGSATRLTVQHKPSGGAWTAVATSVDPGGTYIDGGNPGVACHAQFGFDANMGITEWRAFEI